MEFFLNLEWAALLKIILLDIVLGGDNAVVIALACAGVPEVYRRRAILGGTAAAVIMRIIILFFAAQLVQLEYIKLVAGIMLFWVGYKLLVTDSDDHAISPKDKVWDAIKAIAIADLVMSVDNVFAVTGAAQSAGEHNTIYAIAGVLLSIPIIVFGATLISKGIERFPIIVWIGGGLLGWVAAEMVVGDLAVAPYFTGVNHLLVHVLGAAAVLVGAYLKKYGANPYFLRHIFSPPKPPQQLPFPNQQETKTS